VRLADRQIVRAVAGHGVERAVLARPAIRARGVAARRAPHGHVDAAARGALLAEQAPDEVVEGADPVREHRRAVILAGHVTRHALPEAVIQGETVRIVDARHGLVVTQAVDRAALTRIAAHLGGGARRLA